MLISLKLGWLKVAKKCKAVTRDMRKAHRERYRIEVDGFCRQKRGSLAQRLSCDYVIKDRTDRGGKVVL